MIFGMNSRKPLVYRHNAAECFPFGNFSFAVGALSDNAGDGAIPYSKRFAPNCQNRYPSPSKRPDPFGVRSCLSKVIRQSFADAAKSRRIHFRLLRERVDSGPITNLAGGREKCGTRNISLDLWSLRRWPGVLTMMQSADWPALQAARSSQTQRAAARLQAHLSVVRQACSATTSTSASKSFDGVEPDGSGVDNHNSDTSGALPSGGVVFAGRLDADPGQSLNTIVSGRLAVETNTLAAARPRRSIPVRSLRYFDAGTSVGPQHRRQLRNTAVKVITSAAVPARRVLPVRTVISPIKQTANHGDN